MGHHGLGRSDSRYHEVVASNVLHRYHSLLDFLQSRPPSPVTQPGSLASPFDPPHLEKFLSGMPNSTSPGESGITYYILKAGGRPVLLMLHLLFPRLWHLTSPYTLGSCLAVLPAPWSRYLLSPIYKAGKTPPLDPLHPVNYRGIALGDILGMLWQKGLLSELQREVAARDLLTPAQGACQPGRQPFDTTYTLISYILHCKRSLGRPTYVFFGDISLAFPSVFREKLLLVLSDYGISDVVWQHLRALHLSVKIRVLHGYNPADSFSTLLKGLTEGGRLSPLLWGLYISDLVRSLQTRFPDVVVPSTSLLIFIAILLFVDDFCLLSNTAPQLLDLMRHTQLWCEANRIDISFTKSKVVAFCESPVQQRRRAHLSWFLQSSFPAPSYHPILEVALFHYLGTTLDSGLTFLAHLKLIRSRIWSAHYALANARSCPRSPLSSGPATILYHLWYAKVAVHALSNLVVLHSPAHRNQLQVLLNKSLAATFRVPLTAVPCLHLELGFPPLDLQAAVALARLHCRLHLLPSDTLAHRMFTIRRSYPGGPALSSLELAMRRSLDLLGSFALWDNFQLPPKVLLALPRHRERAYARSLRPVVTGLWLLRLGPRPPPPPITSRLSAYLSLTSPELGRRDLFRPAPYLRALPHHPSLPLLRLRCQSSLLPTPLHLPPPPRRYRLYSQRLCPFCPPPSPLGDALHHLCPGLGRPTLP